MNNEQLIQIYKEAYIKKAFDVDIKVGDVILTGRYKNKRTVVKEIGVDELGQHTVNGQKLLMCRIEKQLPEDKKSSFTQELNKKDE